MLLTEALTPGEIEAAFVATALEQDGGPFDWNRLAEFLNSRLADQRDAALGDAPAFRQLV